MMRNGKVYQRVRLVPPISATGCSSLPTPTSSQPGGSPEKYLERKDETRLFDLEPTDVFRRVQSEALFYTPQARDGDSRRGVSSPAKRAQAGKQVSLTEQVGGKLNPTWVEWLMGFPEGWTELPR
jgi:hypothetical protein